jgi:hypothetical protein
MTEDNIPVSRLKRNLTSLKSWLKGVSSPRKAVLSITVGFYLGLFPIVGLTTLLCLLATFLFRLNPLIIQAVNFSVFPLQLISIYPFLKVGRILFFTRKDLLSVVSLKQLLTADGWDYFCYWCESVAGGIAVWFIFSILTGVFMYHFLLQAAKKYYLNLTQT